MPNPDRRAVPPPIPEEARKKSLPEEVRKEAETQVTPKREMSEDLEEALADMHKTAESLLNVTVPPEKMFPHQTSETLGNDMVMDWVDDAQNFEILLSKLPAVPSEESEMREAVIYTSKNPEAAKRIWQEAEAAAKTAKNAAELYDAIVKARDEIEKKYDSWSDFQFDRKKGAWVHIPVVRHSRGDARRAAAAKQQVKAAYERASLPKNEAAWPMGGAPLKEDAGLLESQSSMQVSELQGKIAEMEKGQQHYRDILRRESDMTPEQIEAMLAGVAKPKNERMAEDLKRYAAEEREIEALHEQIRHLKTQSSVERKGDDATEVMAEDLKRNYGVDVTGHRSPVGSFMLGLRSLVNPGLRRAMKAYNTELHKPDYPAEGVSLDTAPMTEPVVDAAAQQKLENEWFSKSARQIHKEAYEKAQELAAIRKVVLEKPPKAGMEKATDAELAAYREYGAKVADTTYDLTGHVSTVVLEGMEQDIKRDFGIDMDAVAGYKPMDRLMLGIRKLFSPKLRKAMNTYRKTREKRGSATQKWAEDSLNEKGKNS